MAIISTSCRHGQIEILVNDKVTVQDRYGWLVDGKRAGRGVCNLLDDLWKDLKESVDKGFRGSTMFHSRMR